MIKRLFPSQLRVNMASGVATTTVNVLVTALGYPAYLHFLGYEKYGVWLILSTVLSFTQLSNLGIGSAVMKLVAEEYGRGDMKAVQEYVSTAIAMLCFSGLVSLAVIMSLKVPILGLFKLDAVSMGTALQLLPYMGLICLLVFIVQVLSATLSGLGRMDLANYSDSVGRILAMTFSILLLYNGVGIKSMLLGSVCSYVFIFICNICLIQRCHPFEFFKLSNCNTVSLKKLLSIGCGMFGGSLVAMLLGPFNKVMLSRYVGVSSIPLYEIAFNGTMQLRAMIESGFRAISPEVSRLTSNFDGVAKKKITMINLHAVKFVWLYGSSFYVLLLLFITPILNVWLGARFVEPLPAIFRIMLAGTFISLLGVPSYYILLGLGRTSVIFTHNVVQSCTNATLVFALVLLGTKMSIEVFIWVVAVSMVLSNLYLVWQKRMTLNKFACWAA